MLKTSAIVVGAGHCGLAMSRCLPTVPSTTSCWNAVR